MCDQLAVEDTRICVIHKCNQGLGLARNTTIEHATGEYIVFVDSDDWIEPKEIEEYVKYYRRLSCSDGYFWTRPRG